MRNNDLLNIYENAKILKTLNGFELSQAIVLNLRLIKSELIDVLDETYGQSDKLKEFINKRNELIKEYSKKDELGEIIMRGKETIIENKVEFEGKYLILRNTYEDTLKEAQERTAAMVEALEKESTIEFHKIDTEWLKTINITVEQMDLIQDWIKK